ARLSRRRTTRPAARRAASAAATWVPIQSDRARTSSWGGRGFAFGGISPALRRFSTVSHRSPAASSAKSTEMRARRSFTLVCWAPWHSRQWGARNGRTWSSKARFGSAACARRQVKGNRARRTEQGRYTADLRGGAGSGKAVGWDVSILPRLYLPAG